MSDERKRVTVSVTLEYADDGMNIYDAVLFEIQQAESIQIPFPDGTGEVAIIKEYPTWRAETVITVGDWPPADASVKGASFDYTIIDDPFAEADVYTNLDDFIAEVEAEADDAPADDPFAEVNDLRAEVARLANELEAMRAGTRTVVDNSAAMRKEVAGLREQLAKATSERDAAVGHLRELVKPWDERDWSHYPAAKNWLSAYDAQHTSKPDGAQEGE